MFRIVKPSVVCKPCHDRTTCIVTNAGRFDEVWFTREDNVYVEKAGDKRYLVIDDYVDHLNNPYKSEGGKDYWYTDKEWMVAVCYNKSYNLNFTIRSNSNIVPARYGREGGLVIVYAKKSVFEDVVNELF